MNLESVTNLKLTYEMKMVIYLQILTIIFTIGKITSVSYEMFMTLTLYGTQKYTQLSH